ncbi:hypothetical protein NFJ02_18g30210 [Pycnococcus provasolii]
MPRRGSSQVIPITTHTHTKQTNKQIHSRRWRRRSRASTRTRACWRRLLSTTRESRFGRRRTRT